MRTILVWLLLSPLAFAQWGIGQRTFTVSATVACSGHCVMVKWQGSPLATSYNVYRFTGSCTSPTFGTAYATGILAAPWKDTAVISGTTYCYTMTAVNTSGESADSSTTQAVIP